jgi:conjugative relaxase-like TrwC/TraI family protein
MLTISPIKNIDYYEQWTSKEYYCNAGDPPGQWAGYMAHLLGLSGAVNTQEYHNLMQGFSPDGKESLVRNAGKSHIPGHDLTFSAPKSVSILQVYDKHGVIQLAHEKAVKAALYFIEQHAAFTQRGTKEKRLEPLPGLLYSTFLHFESRSEDMQTHSHCLVYNLSRRHDFSCGAVHSRSYYQWMMASGSVQS